MRTAVYASVLAVTAASIALPQETQPGGENYVVRSDVNVIVLHATVQDGHGGFVSGLPQNAFKLTEDGAPQTITTFSSADVPVAVGLVIDHSGSMGRRYKDVITGALLFIRDSLKEDQIFVVNFNDQPQLGLPSDRLFSSNIAELRTALLSGTVGGHTALYDAISLALDHLNKANLMKKVLLIISDGADNRSGHTLDEVTKRADRSGVLMYTVGLFDENSQDRNPGVLKQLARQSGGLVYLPESLEKLSDICSQIAKDIRSQYTVGYSSGKASNPGYHQVKLTASDSRNRQLRVRTRTGFYGVSPESSKKPAAP
jgi:Ca-activated chloride channel family protein